MSDRADIIVVKEGQARIFHHRWGATVLRRMFTNGPEASLREAEGGSSSRSIEDILAGAILDLDRRTLTLIGSTEVICSGGFLGSDRERWTPDEVLPSLAPYWPGWTLCFEPATHIIEPLVALVRHQGVSVAASKDPYVEPGHFEDPRWRQLTYRLEVPPKS
ncbi:hypothetical protein [Myxococcus qinghaiensis]|uniref:hypothetical protein n=1 Tax=Myxococcus qinghaiensis TaxID=2906758 RepID=UPI0020A6EF0C|nr:hypothetical protein [Myxococcus qinghaiensis]MCP3163032.1 hypothetical protein [Myxococcus qinghaiensis]